MYSTKNLVAIAVVVLGAVLLFSPDLLLKHFSDDNTFVAKIKDNLTIVSLALIAGGGYYFWINQPKKVGFKSDAYEADDISTLTGSAVDY